MDYKSETLFLNLIKEHRDFIISKSKSKTFNEERDKAWNDIRDALYVSTGKFNDAEYLKHRWSNIQERIKQT